MDAQKYGALLYIDGRSVWEGWGEATDRRIADLPFDQVLATEPEGNSRLWVLADSRIAVVDLVSGATEVAAVVEPSPNREEGALLMTENQRSIAYTVGVQDNSTLVGVATYVGLYDVQTQRTRPLTRLTGSLGLLGSNPQEDALYAVVLGGDGAFSEIQSISLEDGAVTTATELQGYGFAWASESPDGRRIAVLEEDTEVDMVGNLVITRVIAVYNTAAPDAPPLTFSLPQQPNETYGGIWAPDSRRLYFGLSAYSTGDYNPGNLETRGLWQLDMVTGAWTEIPTPSQLIVYPMFVSPDGQAILLNWWDPSSQVYWQVLVDLQTGETIPLSLPVGAQVAAWR